MKDKIIKDIVKQKEEYIISFLKSKGYRPKRTYEYVKNLRKRLLKKGIELVIEEDINYSPEIINNKITGTFNMRCYFKKIDNWEKERKCKC